MHTYIVPLGACQAASALVLRSFYLSSAQSNLTLTLQLYVVCSGNTPSLAYSTRRTTRRSAETTACGISLVSQAGNMLFKVVARRLSTYCEVKGLFLEEQYGIRPDCSTTDMMFVLRRLQKIGRKAGVSLFMCLIATHSHRSTNRR